MTDDIAKVLDEAASAAPEPTQEAPPAAAEPEPVVITPADDDEAAVDGLAAPEGTVTLRMPRPHPYEAGFEFPEGNLDFGPGSRHSATYAQTNIKFHTDGQGDGYAVGVPIDHPMLPELQRQYPQVQIVDSTTGPQVFVCSTCDREYKTKKSLRAHQTTHEAKPKGKAK